MNKRAENTYLALLEGSGLAYALLRMPLQGLSHIYNLAIMLRNLLFDMGLKKITTVTIPVISVGNITAGGGGKTPLVCHLIEYFSKKGLKIAVISRGYGATAGELNDEALLIQKRYAGTLVLCHPKRSITALQAQQAGADIIIADDAFGHRQLHRDLDILIFPPHNPWGFFHTFPAGLLREPLTSIRRADIIISQSPLEDIHPVLKKHKVSAPLLYARKKTTAPRHLQTDKENPTITSALLACGIAQPKSFKDSAQKQGISVLDCISFDDHHAFSKADALQLYDQAKGAPLLITEKDAVKLKAFSAELPPTYYLPLTLEIEQHQHLDKKLNELLDRR